MAGIDSGDEIPAVPGQGVEQGDAGGAVPDARLFFREGAPAEVDAFLCVDEHETFGQFRARGEL